MEIKKNFTSLASLSADPSTPLPCHVMEHVRARYHLLLNEFKRLARLKTQSLKIQSQPCGGMLVHVPCW